MKKMITVFLTIILILSLVACGKSSDNNNTGESTTIENNETNVMEDTNNSPSNTEDTSNASKDTDTPGTDTSERDEQDETTSAENPTDTDSVNSDTQEKPNDTTVETEHIHEYTKTVVAPDCTNEGYATFSCACGDNYISDKTSPIGHKYGEWKTTKEPTETTTGISERTCSACSNTETKTLGMIISVHTHSYTSKITKAATCKNEGIKTYTCSCGDNYSEKIDKINHSYSSVVTKPTCVNQGYTTYTCSSCKDTYKDKITVALGHAYKDTVIAPTCTSEGYTAHKCSRCDVYYESDRVAKTNHPYNSVVTKPTCTNTGYTTYTCSVCKYSYQGNTTNELGHAYKDTIIAPTCTSEGYTTHKCSRCDASYKSDTVAKINHSYSSVVSKPTCTKTGYTTYTCSVCKHSYQGNTKAALGHAYNDTVVSPTCTKEGYTAHKCSRCEAYYESDKVAKLAHSYKEVSSKTYCDAEGEKIEKCSACGYQRKTALAATGHVTKTETKAATCTKDGYTKIVCTKCGEVFSNTTIPSRGGHEYTVMRMSDACIRYLNTWNSSYYMTFANYRDWNVDICKHCDDIEIETLRLAYTALEAAEIMLGYVNELREEYYGHSYYNMQLHPKLLELAEIRAEEISINYSHLGGTMTCAAENIASSLSGPNLIDYFNAWLTSSGHYSNMIARDNIYFGFAIVRNVLDPRDTSGMYAVQLFWTEGGHNAYFS